MSIFVSLLLLVSPLAANEPAPVEANQPRNIVVITVDDLKPVLGCCGDKLAHTPNIDRLATRGTLFTAAYCQQAVCAPSRISMFTGRRPDFTGIQDLQTSMRDIDPAAITLSQHFRSLGRRSVGMGKVLHGADKDDAEKSWDHWFESEDLAWHQGQAAVLGKFQSPAAQALLAELRGKRKKDPPTALVMKELKARKLYTAVEALDLPDAAYGDGALAASAITQLGDFKKGGQPFCLVLGFMKPHLPLCAPKKYWDLFKRQDMPLAAWRQNSEGGTPLALHTFGELGAFTGFTAGVQPSEDSQRELIHAYYASTAYVDAQIGKVIDELDRLGLADSTAIVLWGDHGWHLGDHGLWCKHSNFEQAVRAPLIIAGPGLKRGQVNASPVEMIDIFPTLCEVTGAAAPSGLQGKSLVPILKGSAAAVHDYAVSQYPRNGKVGYSLRQGSWRLTAWMKPGFLSQEPFNADRIAAIELYDYASDPDETRNRADDPAAAADRARLLASLAAFFKTQENPGAGTAMLAKMKAARRDKDRGE